MYLHKISGINFNNIKSWWYWLNGRYMLMKIIVKQHLIGSLKLSSELNSMGLRLMSFWTHRTDWPLTIFLHESFSSVETLLIWVQSKSPWGYIWWVLPERLAQWLLAIFLHEIFSSVETLWIPATESVVSANLVF